MRQTSSISGSRRSRTSSAITSVFSAPPDGDRRREGTDHQGRRHRGDRRERPRPATDPTDARRSASGCARRVRARLPRLRSTGWTASSSTPCCPAAVCSSRSGCSAATRRRMRPSPSRPSTRSSSAGGSSSTRWRFVAPRSMARPPRAPGRIASRRRPGPPRRGAQPAGAEALATSLADLGLRRPTIVFGAMRGKRVTAVLRALARLERFNLHQVDDPGALPPESLARICAASPAAGRNGSHGSAGTQNRRRRSACGRRLALSRRRGARHDHGHDGGRMNAMPLEWGDARTSWASST